MISYIRIDGKEVKFQNEKPVLRGLRLTPRNHKSNYLITEGELLKEINQKHFLPNFSKAHFYLKNVIQESSINIPILLGIAMFFSKTVQIPLFREYRRRHLTLVYWFHIHFKEIKSFIANHEIIINFKGKEYKFE